MAANHVLMIATDLLFCLQLVEIASNTSNKTSNTNYVNSSLDYHHVHSTLRFRGHVT